MGVVPEPSLNVLFSLQPHTIARVRSMLEKAELAKRHIPVARWILIGLMSASWASANPPSPEAGREPEPLPGAGHFQRGSVHGALLVGYGIGFRMGSESNRELSRELAGVRLMEYIPRPSEPGIAGTWKLSWKARSFTTPHRMAVLEVG